MNASTIQHLRGWRVIALAVALPIALLGNGSVAIGSEDAENDTVPHSRAEPAAPVEPHPLSVAPLDHATYPEDRPSWVDESPQLDGSVAIWPVKSLLRPDPEQAEESLRLQARGAAAAYAEHVLGEDRARLLRDVSLIDPMLDQLPVEDHYRGTATLAGRTVYESAVRLRFDESFRRSLARAWQEREVRGRLTAVGVAGGMGLCLLLSGTGLVRRFTRPKRAS